MTSYVFPSNLNNVILHPKGLEQRSRKWKVEQDIKEADLYRISPTQT